MHQDVTRPSDIANLKHDLIVAVTGWAGDTPLTELIFPRAYPLCERANLPTDTGPGRPVQGCRTYVGTADSDPLDMVLLENGDEYEGTRGTAIEWDVPTIE